MQTKLLIAVADILNGEYNSLIFRDLQNGLTQGIQIVTPRLDQFLSRKLDITYKTTTHSCLRLIRFILKFTVKMIDYNKLK